VVAPPEGVAVFAIAVPLTPHSSGAIDKIATVRLATKTDENLIALSSNRLGQPIPSQTPGYHANGATANFKSGHYESKQASPPAAHGNAGPIREYDAVRLG
jgi:hypothetical protein